MQIIKNEKAKESSLPGFAIIGLLLAGTVAMISSLAAPKGSLSGPAYLLISVIVFIYLIQFFFRKR